MISSCSTGNPNEACIIKHFSLLAHNPAESRGGCNTPRSKYLPGGGAPGRDGVTRPGGGGGPRLEGGVLLLSVVGVLFLVLSAEGGAGR